MGHDYTITFDDSTFEETYKNRDKELVVIKGEWRLQENYILLNDLTLNGIELESRETIFNGHGTWQDRNWEIHKLDSNMLKINVPHSADGDPPVFYLEKKK